MYKCDWHFAADDFVHVITVSCFAYMCVIPELAVNVVYGRLYGGGKKTGNIDGMHRHTHIKIQYSMHSAHTHSTIHSIPFRIRVSSSERTQIEPVDEVNIMQQSSKNKNDKCAYTYSMLLRVLNLRLKDFDGLRTVLLALSLSFTGRIISTASFHRIDFNRKVQRKKGEQQKMRMRKSYR